MAKKSAQFGRFFFFALPCIVEENITGDLLEIAAPRPQISRTSPDKRLISLSKLSWHSPCFSPDKGQYGSIFYNSGDAT
jgi:hypothetical protein